MKTIRLILICLLVSGLCRGQALEISLPEGAKITVRLEQDLSGETAKEGQTVQLSVMEEVKVGDVVAIREGANVTGKVLLAQPKRRMGRTGIIDFSIERVTAADQTSIPLRYTVNKKEGGSNAVSTGAITAGVAIAFFPAAPFVLLRTGKEARVDKGTVFEVFTDQVHTLSVKAEVKNVQVDVVSDPTGAEVEINGDFIGSTPLAVNLPDGDYEIVLKKKGFLDWNRSLKVVGSNVGINAELEPEAATASAASAGNETAAAQAETTPIPPPQTPAYEPAAVANKPAEPRKQEPSVPAPAEKPAAAAGKPAEPRKPEPRKPEPSPGATATVKFEDENYVVHIGAIGKNEDGKMSVELLGVGGTLPLRNGRVVPPLGMRITVNGQTLEYQSLSASAAGHIFHFDTTAAPEKIIVFGNDGSEKSSVTFDGKTRLPGSEPPSGAKTSADSSPAKTSKPAAPAIAAKPYDASKGSHDIVDLIENKIVEVEIQGRDITYVNVRIRRLVDYPVTVLVPVGSFFVSANTSVQNMVATAESRTTLSGSDWQTISVSAACANRPRDIPGGSDRFTVQRSPQQKELAALMPVLNKANANMATKQAAVWIITDNAGYGDLGILTSSPGNTRVIGYEAAARAMRVCSDAGIDITKKNIWRDRQAILNSLPEGDLKKWLQAFGEP